MDINTLEYLQESPMKVGLMSVTANKWKELIRLAIIGKEHENATNSQRG